MLLNKMKTNKNPQYQFSIYHNLKKNCDFLVYLE